VQVCTGTLVVVAGAGQVVCVQLLEELADVGVQLAAGTFDVSLFAQVVVVQPLPDAAVAGVHEATGTLLVLFVPQSVAVQLLPELAATGVQLETPVGPVVTGAGHDVLV